MRRETEFLARNGAGLWASPKAGTKRKTSGVFSDLGLDKNGCLCEGLRERGGKTRPSEITPPDATPRGSLHELIASLLRRDKGAD